MNNDCRFQIIMEEIEISNRMNRIYKFWSIEVGKYKKKYECMEIWKKEWT